MWTCDQTCIFQGMINIQALQWCYTINSLILIAGKKTKVVWPFTTGNRKDLIRFGISVRNAVFKQWKMMRFFQALDVSCNAFMYLLHTWLSEKGRLIQFLFNKNHVIFFSLFYSSLFLLRFSSFIFSFRFHLFNLGFRLFFALSFRIKCKVYLFHTNGRMMYKQSVCLQTSFSSANFFLVCFFLFCLYLLLLSEKSVH